MSKREKAIYDVLWELDKIVHKLAHSRRGNPRIYARDAEDLARKVDHLEKVFKETRE